MAIRARKKNRYRFVLVDLSFKLHFLCFHLCSRDVSCFFMIRDVCLQAVFATSVT